MNHGHGFPIQYNRTTTTSRVKCQVISILFKLVNVYYSTPFYSYCFQCVLFFRSYLCSCIILCQLFVLCLFLFVWNFSFPENMPMAVPMFFVSAIPHTPHTSQYSTHFTVVVSVPDLTGSASVYSKLHMSLPSFHFSSNLVKLKAGPDVEFSEKTCSRS